MKASSALVFPCTADRTIMGPLNTAFSFNLYFIAAFYEHFQYTSKLNVLLFHKFNI